MKHVQLQIRDLLAQAFRVMEHCAKPIRIIAQLIGLLCCFGGFVYGQDDNFYHLVNVYSGKLLDMAITEGNPNGAQAHVWESNGQGNQQWILISEGGGSTKSYKIINARTGKLLDQAAIQGNPNGATVYGWEDNRQTNQRWRFVADGSAYKIVNVYNNKLLNMAIFSGNPNGAKVHAWEDNGQTNQRWRLVPVNAPGLMTQQTRYVFGNTAANAELGAAVALNGHTMVLGAPGLESAYVYFFDGTGWKSQGTLTASDRTNGDGFGRAVALSGDTIVVGARYHNGHRGAAYVFVRSGTTWTQVRKLTNPNGATGDWFGSSVSISGPVLVVGSPESSVFTGNTNPRTELKRAGLVFLYVRDTNGQWINGNANTTAGLQPMGHATFGASISVSGSRVVIGAPFVIPTGQIYLCDIEPGTSNWSGCSKLSPQNLTGITNYGRTVAISDTTVAASAINSSSGGQVYLFNRASSGAWQEKARLSPVAGFSEDFGLALALTADALVVSDASAGPTGSVYTYQYSPSNNNVTLFQNLIRQGTTSSGNFFGCALAVSGNRVIVGDSLHGTVPDENSGAVYVFGRALPVAAVSAASYSGDEIAGDAIAAAFGANLATRVAATATTPLPTELEGTRVVIRDSANQERLAQLFFVSPGQINFQIPPATALGRADIIVNTGNGVVSAGTVRVTAVSPGLFSANADGKGIAAAVALRISASGAQSYETVSRFDAATNRFVPVTLDLGPEGEQIFLILFGTGLRGRSGLMAAAAKVGGADMPVLYVGSQGGFAGLDQVNLGPIPRSLAGRGVADIALTLDGKTANVVQMQIK